MNLRRPSPRSYLLAACVGIAFLGLIFLRGALFSPGSRLAELRKIAPLGSSVEQVKAAISRRWGPNSGVSWVNDPDGATREVVVRVGGHHRLEHFPWATGVESHWHFDHTGRLSDISLRYYRETPFAAEQIPVP